jgi:hypothetical protein
MPYVELTVINSNSADFPSGSRVGGYTNGGLLVELAGHDVEEIDYSTLRTTVHIRTALGYQFSIRATDYQQVTIE